MAEKRGQSPEQIALQRLLKADADAKAYLSDAHAHTASVLAEGQAAGLHLIDQARTAAETEAMARRADAAARLQAEADQVQAHARQAADAMYRRARERLPVAVTLVVGWVKAEA